MKHLFSLEGEAALAAALSRRPLLAFDFDGTLAPIVARPADARLSEAVTARLAVLASRFPLAIVTGRSVDDVSGRLGFEPRFVVGNHGAELDGRPPETSDSSALADFRARLKDRGALLSAAGVTVEDKGYSVALHFRSARSRVRARLAIADLLECSDPELRVFGGKLVVNVMPRRSPDKADAVRTLLGRCTADCVIFAGDDVNDEPVFASAPDGWLTIRVGRDDSLSRAMFFIDSPAEMAGLLEKMIAAMPGAQSG